MVLLQLFLILTLHTLTLSKSSPLVSIIISSYNKGEYLDLSLESALKQSYSNTEIVIVDDGSHD
jgi:cellulose synthase/poly-beta-1,6-N-acetylglucosamine synthase-like glycosyltransferase